MQSIPAANFTKGRIKAIRLLVVHDMEAPEGPLTAENVARFFANPSTKASAHVCIDNNSAVRCVADGDTAWHAPGANADGLGGEFAGYARQTAKDWDDDYSRQVLEQAAIVYAAWAVKYSIPVVHLSVADILAGKKGFAGHRDITAAYHKSDHQDPGTEFPWAKFLALVKAHTVGAPVKAPTVPAKPAVRPAPTPVTPSPTKPAQGDSEAPPADPRLHLGNQGQAVLNVQTALFRAGYELDMTGKFDDKTDRALRAFQKAKGLNPDGITWASTWAALREVK